MKKTLLYLICYCYTLISYAQVDTTQKIDYATRNSPAQQQKPYLILISADGFRYDYAEKYQAKNLLELRKGGVQAAWMLPSYPSVTFPNHYTIATGLYPSHHGIVDNKFYDRKRKDFYAVGNRPKVTDGTWYGGTPLWVLAEQQQMLSASFYWVGSEAAIKHTRPTYYYLYNESIGMEQRIQTVVNWLNLPAERRPHLITFYLPEVDHAGHLYGPDSEETAESVRVIDTAVARLVQEVAKTGLKDVNYIFLSDHGMTNIDNEHTLPLPADIDTAKFIIPSGGTQIQLYAKNEADIIPTYQKLKQRAQQFKVYLKSEVPARMHYGAKDDYMNRMGDILLIPEWPKVFNLTGKKPIIGWHGFDPVLVPQMRATFYTWGPAFKKHLRIKPFENVNVYPIASKILGLSYQQKIDGNTKIAKQILR